MYMYVCYIYKCRCGYYCVGIKAAENMFFYTHWCDFRTFLQFICTSHCLSIAFLAYHIQWMAREGILLVVYVCRFFFQASEAGPFASLQELRNNPAHMSVFIRYLNTNKNPNGLVSVYWLASSLYIPIHVFMLYSRHCVFTLLIEVYILQCQLLCVWLLLSTYMICNCSCSTWLPWATRTTVRLGIFVRGAWTSSGPSSWSSLYVDMQ